MEWLRFTDLERQYGARTLFSGVSGVLRDRSRVGLIGANGIGKSSLLRILVGRDEPDAGTIARARNTRLGYLSQAGVEDATDTLRELLSTAFVRIHEEEAQLRALETALSAAAERRDSVKEATLLQRYGEARGAFERHGGEALERKMGSMLADFGFDDADLDRQLSAFSGGQRTRAAIARLLLEEPDYLVFDEPTNHLDIKTVRWLEMFLVNDARACVIVSHDRTFLDRVVSEIWELDQGKLERYLCVSGRAYADYIDQKTVRVAQAQRDYEASVVEERRQRSAIAELRTHGSHNYSHVRSREKRLAKLERVAEPARMGGKLAIKLDTSRPATAGLALRISGLTKGFRKPLLQDLSFDVRRGERLAIVGDNGCGKSTLLNIISGTVKPDSGEVRVSDGVTLAYFSQESDAALPRGVSAVEAVLQIAPIVPEAARALLGRIGVSGETADKPVETFSGGERRRIMLACLMARAADCLLLDEPTNDLDIPSREALEAVLAEFAGAMIVASHDRYLLARLAERVVALGDGAAIVYDGNYEAYQRSLEGATVPRGREPPKPLSAAAEKRQDEREERQRRAAATREIAACEAEVARLDRLCADLRAEFSDPGTYINPERVVKLGGELKAAENAAAAALKRWETLSLAVEEHST